jgi:hypothetical protein
MKATYTSRRHACVSIRSIAHTVLGDVEVQRHLGTGSGYSRYRALDQGRVQAASLIYGERFLAIHSSLGYRVYLRCTCHLSFHLLR